LGWGAVKELIMAKVTCTRCGLELLRMRKEHKLFCAKIPRPIELKKEVLEIGLKAAAKQYGVASQSLHGHFKALWPDEYQAALGDVGSNLFMQPKRKYQLVPKDHPKCKHCTVNLLDGEANHCAVCVARYNKKR